MRLVDVVALDSRGAVADFGQTVIIMTSNIGAARSSRPVGFVDPAKDEREAARGHIMDEVRGALAPELFNRLDDVVVFDPLTASAIHQIAAREVEAAVGRLAARGLRFELEEGVINRLAEVGYDPAYGARHLHRNLERLLLQPAARLRPGSYRLTCGDDEGFAFAPRR